MEKVADMTQGRPLGLLVRFAWPLLVGSLCQLLYTAADGAVVGQMLGVNAFAAVGASGFLSWLVTDMILGLTQGFGILFGQLFGRKQWPMLRQAITAAMVIGLGAGAVMTMLGLVTTGAVLRLMNTPDLILALAVSYLQVLFCGVLVTMFNRLAFTLLLSLGNSRTPVTGNIISCVLNIVLDILLVGELGWGVEGAAVATVLAQFICLMYCLIKLWDIPELRPLDLRLSPVLMDKLLRLGGPLAFRNGVISLGGLFVQSAVNGYGTLFVAGMAAVEKYFGLLNLPGDALEGAFANFSAQNYGARRMDRLKEGIRCSVLLSLISWGIIAAGVAVWGRELLGLLVSGSPADLEQLLSVGYEYLMILVLSIPLMYLLCLYRSGLEGMGNVLAPTFSGFMELGLRILAVLVLPGVLGRWGIYLANPLGWLGAMILLAVSYHRVYRQKSGNRQEE